ncbi:MAG TPA: HsdR family type I site-specific deoxyribonuclease, partial [Bacteroidota bacterium]|nr:HsdR family type I site-specific deoxyribonuclease [Bacteroidota bacterium]
MSDLGQEKQDVQDPLIQYACEIGWQYLKPDDVQRMRRGTSNLILREIFATQMEKLNSHFIDSVMVAELIKRLEGTQSNIMGNKEVLEFLKGKKQIYVPLQKRELDVKIIDKNPDNNSYYVSDEFKFTNGRNTNRYDAVFFINGIPVFLVETKSAHKVGAMEEALKQVERYHNECPEAMAMMQVYIITNVLGFYYSPTWNFSIKNIFNWKTEDNNIEYEKVVKDFFNKKKSIETILNYILFIEKEEKLNKVILRPYQMRAIKKIEARAANKKKMRGLIWHTQGSGKTYTMIKAAQRIIENPAFENPTVIMIVDRNELQQQLFKNLGSLGFGRSLVITSKKMLREVLKRDTRGIIVTLIQKFDKMPENINTNDNIIVLVDEAHRTTSGKLGNYLTGALPNAHFIGFTGTPIDKSSTGQSTFSIFGRDDEPKGYLDKYGIAESIKDGSTVKLHYALASNELLPDKETLDREFLRLKEAEGISDIEKLNKILKRAVTLSNMLKNKQRIEAVTKYIVDNYNDFVKPLGYKAFIVGVDREACAMYKQELDKYFPEEFSKVVYSRGVNDSQELQKYYLSEEYEKQIRNDFIRADKDPQILIVTEKLLTGYDAPILYCMYLDKPMRDHVLLQTIARVNRPYEDKDRIKKPCGFIVDFVGVLDNLKAALAFDSVDISGVIDDIQILKDKFAEQMEIARQDYLSITKGIKQDKAIEAVLTHFKDEETRANFYDFYNELSKMYEVISPDKFLSPYLEDYDILSRMYKILKENYDSQEPIPATLSRKTAQLLQENVNFGGLKSELEIYEINDQTIEKLQKSNASEIEQIFNLIKSVEAEVSRDAEKNTYLISIGERAEEIARRFKENQMSVAETLENLKDIVEEINEARRERKNKNMTDEVFSIYWILSSNKIQDAE